MVLDTLKEQDMQGAFQAWQEHREWCIAAQGDYLQGDGGQIEISYSYCFLQAQSLTFVITPHLIQTSQAHVLRLNSPGNLSVPRAGRDPLITFELSAFQVN